MMCNYVHTLHSDFHYDTYIGICTLAVHAVWTSINDNTILLCHVWLDRALWEVQKLFILCATWEKQRIFYE